MEPGVTKQGGKGRSDGVTSELCSFFDLKPGHEQEVRAAVGRFVDTLKMDLSQTMKTGLRETRFVVFDDGKRLEWCTTFELDWDPYFDDALLLVGIENFIDWLQHTEQFDKVQEWVASAGGVEKLSKGHPELQETVKKHVGGLKAIIQGQQVQAAAYMNTIGALTMPEIKKDHDLEETFEKVLDDPAAGQALQQEPALKPLLEVASA